MRLFWVDDLFLWVDVFFHAYLYFDHSRSAKLWRESLQWSWYTISIQSLTALWLHLDPKLKAVAWRPRAISGTALPSIRLNLVQVVWLGNKFLGICAIWRQGLPTCRVREQRQPVRVHERGSQCQGHTSSQEQVDWILTLQPHTTFHHWFCKGRTTESCIV